MLPLAPAAAELSLSCASLQEALTEFKRRGLVDIDETTGEIFVLAWFRFNKFPPGPRRNVLSNELRKIESQRLKCIVEKSIENSIGYIFNNEESTTYAPSKDKRREVKPPTPLPPPERAALPSPGGREGEKIENLIAATIRARQNKDPVQNPTGWAKYAMNCASEGDFGPLEPGRLLLANEKKKVEAEERYKDRLKLPTNLTESAAALKAGSEIIEQVRQRRKAA